MTLVRVQVPPLAPIILVDDFETSFGPAPSRAGLILQFMLVLDAHTININDGLASHAGEPPIWDKAIVPCFAPMLTPIMLPSKGAKIPCA